MRNSIAGIHRINVARPGSQDTNLGEEQADNGLEFQSGDLVDKQDSQQKTLRYVDTFVKLIPGEAITLYLTFRGIIVAAQNPETVKVFLAIVCLIAVFLIRLLTTMDPNAAQQWKTIEWSTVGLTCIAYLLWIYALGDKIWFHSPIPDQQVFAQIAVGFWGAITPLVILQFGSLSNN